MVKRLFFIFLLFFVSASFFGQSARLTVLVDDLRNTDGDLMIGVFDNPNNFKTKTHPAFKASTKITDTKMKYVFPEVPYNFYAIAVFHDENNDDTLNTKALGIPLEGIGFSGKLQSKFKPPAFGHIVFRVKNDTTIYIKMIYPKSTQKQEE